MRDSVAWGWGEKDPWGPWRDVVKKIEKERGKIRMLAVVLRAVDPERWDVVVAAPWLDPAKRETYEFLNRMLDECLTEDERRRISRVVPVSVDDPALLNNSWSLSRHNEHWYATNSNYFMGTHVYEQLIYLSGQ